MKKFSSKFSVRFWGVRGSFSVAEADCFGYGGHTTCIEVRVDNRLIIIDSGTGIRNLGWSLMANQAPVEADIFISHTHKDHIEGFMSFLPFFHAENTFRVYGAESHSGKKMKDTINRFFDKDYWPVDLTNLPAKFEWHEMKENTYDLGGGLTVKTIFLAHPVPNLGFRFEYKNKSIAFILDHEAYEPGNDRVISFIKDTSLLVFDSAYTEEEYYKNRQGWGHSSFEKAVESAEKAGVETLIFFHHEPARTDEQLAALEKKYADNAKIKNICAAKEGAVFEV
jgi:phosphoribosyl 1,2-cyclic phosphodiesterase